VCCEKLESVTTCLLSRLRVSSLLQCFGSGVKDPILSVVWVLELFFVSRWISATVTLFHRRVLVRLLGLLAAAINLLRVAGHSSVFGFVDFGPSFPLVLPTGQIVFLWLAVACSLVLSCRKTVPLVSLPAGRCASRSSVSVAVRVVWSLWE
jgi:hypothetical protein